MSLKLPDTITEEQLVKVLKVTRQPHHRAAFVIGFYQCMRISEIAGSKEKISKCHDAKIKEKKVEKEPRKFVLIKRCSVCNKVLTVKDLKDGKDWAIFPLSPEMVDKNLKLIKLKNAKGHKDRHIPIAPESMKYLKHIPMKCGVRALQLAWNKATKSALGHSLNFHLLRHSGITHYISVKKWDSMKVQRLAGHSKIATTQIYTHINPIDLVEEMWGK